MKQTQKPPDAQVIATLLDACKAAQKVIDALPYSQKVAVPGIARILRAAIKLAET